MNAVHLAGRPLAMFSDRAPAGERTRLLEVATPSPARRGAPRRCRGVPRVSDVRGAHDRRRHDSRLAARRLRLHRDRPGAPGTPTGCRTSSSPPRAPTPADPFSGDAALISVGRRRDPRERGQFRADRERRRPLRRIHQYRDEPGDGCLDPRPHGTSTSATPSPARRCASRARSGEPDGDSYDADFSADGRSLVFTSDATNLDRRQRLADEIRGSPTSSSSTAIPRDGTFDAVRPSLRLPGRGPCWPTSYEPAISGDGTKVVFTAETGRARRVPAACVATPGLPHVWR